MGHPSDSIVKWFSEFARPLIQEQDPARLAELDLEVQRIERLARSLDQDLYVCFLGSAGVGKSTLINAMVAGKGVLLPQGGIGPLTAQATSVRYSSTPYFEAEYQSAGHLNQLLFAIERAFDRELGEATQTAPDSAPDIEVVVDQDFLSEAELPTEEDQLRIRAEYQKQARQLIQGSPMGEIDLRYLADSLRAVLGQRPIWQAVPRPEDAGRIERLRACLALARARSSYVRKDSTREDFTKDLESHASGFLAPLIAKLTVGWDSPLLRNGLVLVDLPGLGVANDIYRKVTNEYVSQNARAVVLVVDRSGVTQAAADLLRESRFFVRLLSGADNPDADPVQLLIAVVKVDSVADTEWVQDRALDRSKAQNWGEHFDSVCGRMLTVIGSQLRDELNTMGDTGGDEPRPERQRMIELILKTVAIHPVSALEYRRLLEGDDEDRPRIKKAEESRVPDLMEGLASLAASRRGAASTGMTGAANDLRKRLHSAIKLIDRKQDQTARAKQDLERLRVAVEPISRKLALEVRARQGAFYNCLRETIPQGMKSNVSLATRSASDEINKYIFGLEVASWATLRAAVRRGGTFVGARRIDLPVHFSVCFEEPVAAVWALHVLSPLRSKTRELATAYLAIAADMIDSAQHAVEPEVLALARLEREMMEAQARTISDIGDERIEMLRARVRHDLVAKVEGRIRERCRRFVDARQDVGAGVKKRMIELCKELVPDVMAVAEEVAMQILTSHFEEAAGDVRIALGQFPDPVERMEKALLSSRERESPSEQQAREAVRLWVAKTLEADPGEVTAAGPA